MSDFFGFLVDHWILSSLFIFILFALIMTEFRGRLLGFKDIPPNEAVRLMNQDNAIVLDVRDEATFNSGHILNAKNIPVGLLESRLGELSESRSNPVLLVCRSGQDSARAGGVLQKQGFAEIYKLAGGMMAWENANLPLIK
ncbi:MAG: rhodanese-like domain-containing protein [Gammaproteobacteria bacterium]|nr:rhodanese-like domain-containing protein [Gammaproteobacteria bacterium]